MQKPSPFKTLSSRIAYQNPWMRIREDTVIRPDGSEGIYGVMESKDSVVVIVVNDKGEIGFNYIFRYPSQAWKWELPGGGGDGQDVIEASKRELMEEAGIEAADWHVLGSTRVCNGFMTERQANVLAQGLSYHKATDTEEGIAKFVFFSLEKINEMIAVGEIDDGQSIAALYQYKLWLQNNNNQQT
jgi:8-oxo-dGTP pyrophosphatase MutT (NUDIX family)